MHPEADALLSAIFAHPDDDTPRLVYADWLEEHGEEAYAHFIRLDCELARREVMPPADRKVMRRRRHDLWLEVEKQWADRLTGLSLSYQYFNRGILGRIPAVATQTFVAHSSNWWPLLPVREVALRDPQGHEAALAACPYLARLRGLEIGNPGWYDPLASEPALPEAVLCEIAHSPFPQQLQAFSVGPIETGRASLEKLAGAPFMDRLRGDGFRLRLRLTGQQADDVYLKGHPGVSARDTLHEFLQESAADFGL